jgi:hypothetical protein
MIRSPAGFDGGDRIKRYLDYYQPSYGVMMLSAGQFSPASLFAAGEQGAWYDPSDFSTMFQDSAGTTPVTAVEQPVGLILDKSKNAIGSNGSYRYNLLIQTDDLNDSGYAAFQVTKTVGGVVGPLGRNGTTIREVAVTSLHIIDGTPNFSVTSGTTYTASIYVKPAGRTRVTLNARNTWNTGIPNAYYDLSGAGSVDNVGSGVTATITAVTGGWYLLTYSLAANTTSASAQIYLSLVSTGTTTNYAGDITKGVDVFGYQVNSGATSLTYQRITADWPSTFAGNHASQATSTSRPVLSARVNLLTYSEQFDNAAWSGAPISVTPDATVAPNGETKADEITFTSDVGNFAQIVQYKSVNGGTYTQSVYIKAYPGEEGKTLTFDTPNASGAVTITLTNQWQRVTKTFTVASTVSVGVRLISYTGQNASKFYLWGADLRVTNDGVGIPAYQRVAAATDYDTNGFPLYLRFDGTDDSLATASIDFSATDKMSVFAGVRKLSDGGQAVLETSADATANNGAFSVIVPFAANYEINLRGTTRTLFTVVATAPLTSLLSVQYDISGAGRATEIYPRLNAAIPALTGGGAADAGTGNFGNYPLYIGRRGGTSLPFNGRLYSLIVRGAQSTDAQIASTETWVNGKTAAY